MIMLMQMMNGLIKHQGMLFLDCRSIVDDGNTELEIDLTL
jgi:hypothetical protein